MQFSKIVMRQAVLTTWLLTSVMPIYAQSQIGAASTAVETSSEAETDRIATGSPLRSRESGHAEGITLVWPVRGPIVETFQPGRDRAIAIGGQAGDPVRAAADGRVEYAGTGLNGYGSLIIVQHNADFLTTYAHGRRLLVKTGDVVRQGQEIAEMGILDGAQAALLFEVRRDGKPVDPMRYLPMH